MQAPGACLRRDHCFPVAHQRRPVIITWIVKQGLDRGDHATFRGKRGASHRCRRVTVSSNSVMLWGAGGVWARHASCHGRHRRHWKIGRG